MKILRNSLLAFGLMAMAALSQNGVPFSKGSLTIITMVLQPASLAPYMPVVPSDLTISYFEVLVSTTNQATSSYRIVLTIQDGNQKITISQEIQKTIQPMSMAAFKVPLSAKVIGFTVTELADPVEFDVTPADAH